MFKFSALTFFFEKWMIEYSRGLCHAFAEGNVDGNSVWRVKRKEIQLDSI